jgi:hypothetical protein
LGRVGPGPEREEAAASSSSSSTRTHEDNFTPRAHCFPLPAAAEAALLSCCITNSFRHTTIHSNTFKRGNAGKILLLVDDKINAHDDIIIRMNHAFHQLVPVLWRSAIVFSVVIVHDKVVFFLVLIGSFVQLLLQARYGLNDSKIHDAKTPLVLDTAAVPPWSSPSIIHPSEW